MAELLPHHRRAALALNAAVLHHRIASLSQDELGDMDIEQGRIIVADNTARWLQRGLTLGGWAANLMNPSCRDAYGLHEPIVGAVMANTVVDDGQTIDLSRFHAPTIGGGLVFRMNMDLPTRESTTVDIRRSVSAVLAALIIYDSRLEVSANGIALQADNGGFGGAVIAARGKALTKVDVKSAVATLIHNGKEMGSGAGKSLMGDPVEAAAWIVNVVCAMGYSIREGQELILGTCTPIQPLRTGTWRVSIPMVGDVSLTVTQNT
ncbi:hypothetical protein [Stomatohabitans albus]|uniref:2-keto-4-pentenoate hydratase n=1 Tax=Stomatohabitans albus TaxID=3110766 RepID=UPI00300BFEDA